MIERKLRLGNLYEFYGELLTEKQREILDLYCNDDFSLGEISDNNGISRQAVYDTVKRSEKLLEDYEENLGLFQKFSERQQTVEQAVAELDRILIEIDGSCDPKKLKVELTHVMTLLSEMSNG